MAILVVNASAPAKATPTDWPVFGHDPSRTGVDVGDTILNFHNVHMLHSRWQISFGPGIVADSTPIFIHVPFHRTSRPMLFQTAKNGETFGIDAFTGRIVWRFFTHGPGITQSTPAADPSFESIYVPGVDGFIHKLDAATGHEERAPGFPAQLTRIPQTEKDASPLNVANGYLYANTSGYIGDAPYYDGHVLSVRLSDGETHVFNSLCSHIKTLPTANFCPNSDSGIWGRGGVVVDPDPEMGGRVYAATGNGYFDASTGGDNYGDSVISLSPKATMLLGNYTPMDFTALQNGDTDLGSTSPVMLPRQSRSRTPLMLAQGGKDEIFRLVDRAHLPGVAHELQQISLGAAVFSTPAVWMDGAFRPWVFLTFPSAVLAYRLTTENGSSALVHVWTATPAETFSEGTSPVVSHDMVFVAFDDQIVALDAFNGRTLWSSARAGRTIGPLHWQSPIVVDGWVYCADQNGNLTAYSLPPPRTPREMYFTE
ncbi:MAG: PQQ-binding-like beta-propeller repeat protein [Candidatus Eremiobacteraeota bacterium]|nr:PQQ-binding-like beta-propeller repeat protein [Candidatus Eremiobacteraeota bacterium]